MSVASPATEVIAPHDVEYRSIAGNLRASRGTIEKSFLDMGQRLMDCHELLREISLAYEGMPAALQSEELAGAVSLLDMLRSEARRISTQQDAERAQIDELAVMANGLFDPIERLNREIRNLGFVTTNARIVAAGMAAQREVFDDFAAEMIELGKSAAAIVREFSQSHQKLMQALALANNASHAFRQQHGQTLSIVSARLDVHIEVIESHKRRAIAEVEQSKRLTQQISARIGQAVSALQIGDITRQRLERVEEALHDLSETSTTSATRTAVIKIQTLQLQSASSEFVGEVSAFTEALRSLSTDARAVLNDSAANSDALLTNGGQALAGLAEQLQSMISMLSNFAETRMKLLALGAEVKDCLGAMQERMHAIADLEQSMRLLSINTAVRCARFGEEGQALRVVAQQMRQLSSDAVNAARTVTLELEKSKNTMTDGGAAELVTGCSEASLADEARMAINRINCVVDRMREHAGAIAKSGPQAARLIAQAADVSRSYEGRADDWWTVIELLEPLAASGAEVLEDGEVDLALLERLRSRYTMASERIIHDGVFASLEPGGSFIGSPDDGSVLNGQSK